MTLICYDTYRNESSNVPNNEELLYDDPIRLVFTVIAAVIAVVAPVLNISVVLALLLKKKIIETLKRPRADSVRRLKACNQHTKLSNPEIYIFALAFCDLIKGLCFALFVYSLSLGGRWPRWKGDEGRYGLISCQIYRSTLWSITFSSGLFGWLIAFDRFLIIRYGALYRIKESRRQVTQKIVFITVSALLLLAGITLIYIFANISSPEADLNDRCFTEFLQVPEVYIAIAFLVKALPIVLYFATYYMVHREVKKLEQMFEPDPGSFSRVINIRSASRHRYQLKKHVIFIINGLFFISQFPSFIVSIFMVIKYELCNRQSGAIVERVSGEDVVVMTALSVSYFLNYANTLANPIVYITTIPALRDLVASMYGIAWSGICAPLRWIRYRCAGGGNSYAVAEQSMRRRDSIFEPYTLQQRRKRYSRYANQETASDSMCEDASEAKVKNESGIEGVRYLNLSADQLGKE